MNIIYLTFIPTIAFTLWALYTKYEQRKIADLVILSALDVCVMVNAIIVYQMICAEISTTEHLIQMTVASAIIPLAYTYFAHQVGRQTINHTATFILWALAAFTFVPDIIIFNPFEPFLLPDTPLKPFDIYVLSHGEKLFAMHTGDFATMLQAIVSLVRIVFLIHLLRQHNLKFNAKVYSFGLCWLLIIIFAIMVTTMTYEELCSPFGSWFYFIVYNLLIIFTSFLIAMRYDLYPIETENEEIVEDISVYVHQQYDDLANNLRNIMEHNHLYTDPQLTAEAVIEQLRTNHTYFSQMMSSVWGMSFSEYLNSLRLSRVEQLLRDDTLTIASVATQSGFADAGYMSRKFKAKHGITPSEWRKVNS